MNNYFSLTKEQQQKVLQAAENKIGLPGQAIEKDIWVTTILQIVFTMSCAEHLIFKGGTSISKVWNLIKRFSEDIDLAIDPVVFEITGDITKKKIKKLRNLFLLPKHQTNNLLFVVCCNEQAGKTLRNLPILLN